MIVIEGLAIVTLGLYRPRFRDLPRTVLAAFLITLGIFCIDMLLRFTGLYANANYFYAVETEGNFVSMIVAPNAAELAELYRAGLKGLS